MERKAINYDFLCDLCVCVFQLLFLPLYTVAPHFRPFSIITVVFFWLHRSIRYCGTVSFQVRRICHPTVFAFLLFIVFQLRPFTPPFSLLGNHSTYRRSTNRVYNLTLSYKVRFAPSLSTNAYIFILCQSKYNLICTEHDKTAYQNTRYKYLYIYLEGYWYTAAFKYLTYS